MVVGVFGVYIGFDRPDDERHQSRHQQQNERADQKMIGPGFHFYALSAPFAARPRGP